MPAKVGISTHIQLDSRHELTEFLLHFRQNLEPTSQAANIGRRVSKLSLEPCPFYFTKNYRTV